MATSYDMHWQHMHEVELWKACFLAFGVDPACPHVDYRLLPEDESEYERLMELLKSNLSNRDYFSESTHNTVRLDEFAAWCLDIGWDIPEELAAIAKGVVQGDTDGKVIKGITKQQVITAFSGLHFDSDAGWENALSDVPKWIEPCRVMRGRKGDNSTSATWNPALVAAALLDKRISIKKLDAVFVRLPEWADEWRKVSANDR